jgi:hypothetical protein
VERILSSGAFEGDEGLEAAHRMTGARAQSMKETLDMINKKYGSAEGYVRTVCGLDDEDIEGLRKNLTVKDVQVSAKFSSAGTQRNAML